MPVTGQVPKAPRPRGQLSCLNISEAAVSFAFSQQERSRAGTELVWRLLQTALSTWPLREAESVPSTFGNLESLLTVFVQGGKT